MNNLTTRKIVLGMLMALVLAFSVQGIADALTFSTSKTGDLETKAPNQTFTIRFTATPKSPVVKSTHKDYKRTPSGDVDDSVADVTYYLDDYDPDDDATATGYQNETQVSYDDVHDYDQETINVDLTGPARIIRVGSRIVDISETDDLDMYERTHDSYGTAEEHQKFSGSVSLTLEPTGAGVVTVNVTDETVTADAPTKPPPITFTLYVVNYNLNVSTSALFFSDLRADNYTYADDQFDSPVGFSVTSTANNVSTNHPPVNIEVVEGPGRLYVQKDYTDGSPKSVGRAAKELNISGAVGTSSDTGGTSNVHLDAGGGTNRITITAPGRDPVTAIYVYGRPDIQIVSGNDQRGATNGRLAEPLTVKVRDARGRGIPMVIVTFDTVEMGANFFPVAGTTVFLSETNSNKWGRSYEDIDMNINDPITATSSYPETNAALDPVVVQTDRSGDAKVYFQLGDGDEDRQAVTVDAVGATQKTFRASATDVASTDAATITIADGDGQRADVDEPLDDPLVVLVRDVGGRIVAGAPVRFTTNSGQLAGPESRDPGVYPPLTDPNNPTSVYDDRSDLDANEHTSRFIVVQTDDTGRASVRYNVGDLSGARQVFATIDVSNGRTRTKTFNVNGRASTTRRPADDADDADDEDEDEPSVTVNVPSPVTGTAGETARLTVTAPATSSVTVGHALRETQGLDTFPSANASPATFIGSGTSTLTLPSQAGNYTLTVTVGGTEHRVSVNVTAAAAQTGTLTVAVNPFSGAPGTTATVTVTATDASAQSANVTVNLTATGGTLSNSSVATGTTGTTTVTLTRGSTAGTENFVTVSGPSGYDSVSGRFVIAGPAGSDTTVGEAAEVDVYDGNNQDGLLNSRLADPLVVEVVDANDNPVEDVQVRFQVTQGSGRFSPSRPRTDEDGLAQTRFIPTSSGRIRISASVNGVTARAVFIVQAGEPADALEKVSGDNQSGTPGNALANPFVVEVQDEDGEPLTGHSVTFSVTAGGGSLSETSARTNANGRAQTTLTLGSALGVNSVQASVSGVDSVTFSTNIDAQILVAAANRPVMYWIAGGGLYSLSGAKEAKIAESANGVAVGGGKIYWTSQVNASSGAINSANLDGTNAAVLTSILAVPMGISVDTAGSKLYWTNTRGRIQSANLNGSGIQNVLLDLSDPTDIVVSNGFIYWTEDGNSVRRVNISGQKITRDVAVNLDSVGGLAVGSGKVYWTEMTSASAGTVNGADLDGTNFETLATLLSAPMGISVDTAGSKLYWTNARGRVQSANLNGSMIKNVVEGLISPSKIAIGGANTAEVMTRQPTAKKDNAKYDVNGDGSVNNADSDAITVAIAAGATDAKYDVNGDGTVNVFDLVAIIANRDPGAAGAPTLFGMKMSAVQINRIEEQIDLLIATNDRSPAALRTLVYMQQLLATARPEKTQLFANYPNPFNPETWIPYELATDTHVKITIYNTQGVVIRTLQFGHQSAGYYTDRDRAAYWDGRNALGEQVASGLYFYQLETDEMSSMRKMVILK